MRFIYQLFYVLGILAFSLPASASLKLAKPLTDYTYEEIQDVAYLCRCAYGKKGLVPLLQERGWDIEYCGKAVEDTPLGLKATNGPLTVLSFAGTAFTGPSVVEKFSTLLADIEAVRVNAGKEFNYLPLNATMHKGMHDYYLSIKELFAPLLFKSFCSGENLIIAGHSLGGSLAQLQAFELLSAWEKRADLSAKSACSILTLGAPAFLDQKSAAHLDLNFPGTSHLRLFLKNDPIVEVTRGPVGKPYLITPVEPGESVFVHAGYPVSLPNNDFFAHKCKSYIKAIEARPDTLRALWPMTKPSLLPATPETKDDQAQWGGMEKVFETLNMLSKWREKLSSPFAVETQLPIKSSPLNEFSAVDSYGIQSLKEAFNSAKKPEVMLPFKTTGIPSSWAAPAAAPPFAPGKNNNTFNDMLSARAQINQALHQAKTDALKTLGRTPQVQEEAKLYLLFVPELRKLAAESEDKSLTPIARFWRITDLMTKEQAALQIKRPELTEEEINLQSEEKVFEKIRAQYTQKELLQRVEPQLRNDGEKYTFFAVALSELFSGKELPSFARNALRSYFELANVPFKRLFHEEYEILSAAMQSNFIASLKECPESKKAFDVLARDLKENPALLKEFLASFSGEPSLKSEIKAYILNI